MSRPTLKQGNKGSEVATAQVCLAVNPVDGVFGEMTKTAVMAFQHEQSLQADGVIGPQTWSALEDECDLSPYPPPLLPALDDKTTKAITDMAAKSAIAGYSWRDRGRAPSGYTKGMAIAYANIYRRFYALESSALVMAKADTGNADKDALTWYADMFKDLGMSNATSGIATLRHLFVLLMGLGMRESSGKHCEGRDMSAENVSSDTAEAGLFQQSWNSSSSTTDLQKLLDQYCGGTDAQCAINVFEEGVSCSSSSWQSYGSGTGFKFQKLAKECPQFCVEAAGIGLRHLRQHWGPINRREAEIRREADDMFRAVEDLVPIIPPVIEPAPEIATLTITIDPPGSAHVVVVGSA